MNFLSLSSSIVVSGFLMSGRGLAAQEPVATAGQYAAESFVIDRSDWIYSNNGDGTGYREHTVAVTVQSEAALRTFGVIGINFASASEHVEIHYARVRHKDGSITETPASGALEQPEQVTREAPFYSDLKQEQLPIKNLQMGDTLEWQARIVRTRAEAPGQFWGADSLLEDDAVVLEESIELRVPAASQATVWTNPQLNVKPVETTDGATTIYRWQDAQLKPTTGAAADAAKKAKKGKALTPAEVLDAEEGKLPSVAWTSFKSWEAVGAWYRSLEGQRTLPDDEIKAKVAELIAGKTTQEDKVRALYAYVSTQIRYIGVDFGIGRFQPHEAAEVLHNQYGDCKDKTTLLAAMLTAAGIESDAALIGSQIRFNDALPSPGSFNHLITHLMVDGKEVWLDSTEEIAPYRMMVIVLRGHPALVIPPQGVAKIETTPLDAPFPEVETWTAKGTLDKQGVSESHIVIRTRGDSELLFRAILHQSAPAQYDEMIQQMAHGEGYAGTTSHASVSRPEDTAEPMAIEFDYHRERGGDWENLRLLPQVEPLNLPRVDDNDPPVAPIDLSAPHVQISHAEMKLPPGWSATLPSAVHRKNAYATYDETYKLENGTVITDATLTVIHRRVPVEDWKTYKKFIDDVGSEQYVSLERAPGEQAEAADTGDGAVDPDASAEKLIDKAGTALNLGEVNAAETLLKQAEAKDAQVPKLWSLYGNLALLRGEANLAIEDCRKELALHPHEVTAFMVMASAQQMQNKLTDAAETLRAWAMADPENPRPPTALAGLMLQQKRYPAAMDAANKALQLMSEEDAAKDERLHFTLGMSQLRSGLTAKGEATLVKLLESTENPTLMNSAAYELADAKLDLPLDEEKTRVALIRMEDETQDWTVEEAPREYRPKGSAIFATWDTMGWILYREGKLQPAKSYIEASVLNRSSADVQGHLDEVNQALIGSAKPTAKDVHPAGSQGARTFELGVANGKSGVAEYRLLLQHGHVDISEPAGQKTIAGTEEMLKRADLSAYFPEGSNVKLVKSGMVNCASGKCSLILEP